MSYLFLDFEASSLSKRSYPIEVGWVHEDGAGESHLIRPAPAWTEWDEAAAAVHGIRRASLEREGEAVESVCGRLIELAASHLLLASAPSWDGHWLSMLLRAAGQPRHLVRLRDSEEAFAAAAREQLGAAATEDAVASCIAAARATVEGMPVDHRALSDARREWLVWRAIREDR